MAGESLRLPIGLPVETNADEAADSVEALRDRIMGSTESIKAMQGTLRQLKGTTADVVSAKAALKGKIDQLTGTVSAASLKLVQQGTTYDAAAQKEKKYLEQKKKLSAEFAKGQEAKAKDRTSALSSAIDRAGGPVASLKAKLGELKSVTGESSGAMGMATFAAAGLVAAVAAVVVAVGAAAVSLGKFILSSGNAARSAGLVREAWSGSAQNAANLGTQIDALANKVPTSKAALNDLAVALMKSKLGGQATVDTFNAVAQASSALGDEAGKKIQEFIERGRVMGRMRIDPREMLEGFGNLEFTDVAGALAKQMGVGVEDAKRALFEGRVKLADGAAAMRVAVERKFGELNMRKMLDLNVMSEKLHEKLAGLTNGVKLEPLLKPLGELGKLFDTSTVTGTMLKKLLTAFGDGMVKALVAGIPLAKEFFQGLVIGSLKAYIAFLQTRNALKGVFGDSKIIKDGQIVKLTLGAVELGCYGVAAAALVLGAALAPFVYVGVKIVQVFQGIKDACEAWKTLMVSTDWTATGKAVVDGLIEGLAYGPNKIIAAVKGITGIIKKTFTGEMKIQSPSREMFARGKQVPAGVVGGIEEGLPAVARASRAMADSTKDGADGMGSSSGSRSSSSGGRAPIVVHIHATGGGADAAKALSEPSFLAKLTKAIEDACTGEGIPVQG